MSIYSIPEGECWARTFDYQNYLDWCDRAGHVARRLSPEGYVAFCALMTNEMFKDFGLREEATTET